MIKQLLIALIFISSVNNDGLMITWLQEHKEIE